MSLELPPILRPKLHPGETGPSYLARLERRLSIPFGYLKVAVPREGKDIVSGVHAGQFRLVERLCSLPDGVLTDVQGPPDSIRGPRLMCPDCAGGERVELHPHANSYCCLKHCRWTGPRADPSSPAWLEGLPVVAADIVQADADFRAISESANADTALVLQAVRMFAPAPLGQAPRVPSAQRHPDTVRFLHLVTAQAVQVELLDAAASETDKRVRLERRIATELPGVSVDEAMWRMLLTPTVKGERRRGECRRADHPPAVFGQGAVRATASAVARDRVNPNAGMSTSLQGAKRRVEFDGGGGLAVGAHRDLICRYGHRHQCRDASSDGTRLPAETECPYYAEETTVPSAGSMAHTQPSLAREWHPTLNGSTTPYDVTGSGNSQSFWWACKTGHEWSGSPNNRARGRGCPYCSGRRPTAETSLAALRPDIAAQWDKDANGSLRADEVTPGSGVAVKWICSAGHKYVGRVFARTNGSGCAICANLEVLQGYNDLATTHPDIAKGWDDERNGALGPESVVAGSIAKKHWICPAGHPYTASIASRKLGSGCPICANLRVLVGANDLATTHPDVAASWVAYPGERTPQQVVAGSGHRLHWRCPIGHVYAKPVLKRIASPKCPVCINKLVLPGYNDVRTRYPAIAEDWHPEKNGGDRPELLLPGNRRRWWKCRFGHEQRGTVPNRIITGGCTLCPADERVATPRAAVKSRAAARSGDS